MGTWLIPSTDRLSNRDRQMLDRAIEIAKQSTVKQKHGAVIYKAGRVLAVGVNSIRNVHPTMEMARHNYTTHAEAAAIRGLGSPTVHIAENSTLYVVRVNRQGKPINSMPCSQCLGLLSTHKVKRVVYSA